MNNIKRVAILALCLLGSSANAIAGKSAIRLGYDTGGDDIGTLQFSDGTTKDFKFGTGLFVEVGYEFKTPLQNNNNLSTEFYLGWKNDGSEASNGSIDYTRYLVGLTQFYEVQRLRLGLGITHHFHNRFEQNGFNNMDVRLNNTIGLALSSDYQVGDRMKLGIRYNNLQYQASTQDVDGSSIGFYLVFTD